MKKIVIYMAMNILLSIALPSYAAQEEKSVVSGDSSKSVPLTMSAIYESLSVPTRKAVVLALSFQRASRLEESAKDNHSKKSNISRPLSSCIEKARHVYLKEQKKKTPYVRNVSSNKRPFSPLPKRILPPVPLFHKDSPKPAAVVSEPSK